MFAVAKKLIRTVTVLSIAACGGSNGFAPDGGFGFGEGGIGFVGSGGSGGGGKSLDGSLPGDAGAAHDARSGSDDGSAGDDDGGIVDAATDVLVLTGDAGLDGGDGVTVTFGVPPGFFPSLAWAISGPAGHYSGNVEFGDAHSYEFVVGGIQAGSGYTITLNGQNIYGEPCAGTSAPFDVMPGVVSGAGVVIDCHTADAQPAGVTSGSVGVDASIVFTH